MRGDPTMHRALGRPACAILLVLLIATDGAQAQQNPKLTPINYGNIVLTASTWPFLIAEQEGFFLREGIDFKRVIGGNTTATTQALVAGSTDIAQMNLVNLLAANSAGADLIVIAGDSTVPIYTLIVHPSIKSYADLKGKRLAITGPTDPLNYILARMLSANGLTSFLQYHYGYAKLSTMILSVLARALVSYGATYGGSLVYDYQFNVESLDGSTAWDETESDQLPGDKTHRR